MTAQTVVLNSRDPSPRITDLKTIEGHKRVFLGVEKKKDWYLSVGKEEPEPLSDRSERSHSR